MNGTTRGRRRSAFTLIELLVVITIIGILATMLTVAAGDALAYARLVKCRSNLGQIAHAAQAYAVMFDDTIPPARYDVGNEPKLYWCHYLVRSGCLSGQAVGAQTSKNPLSGSSVFICPDAADLEVAYDTNITNPAQENGHDTPAQGWYKMESNDGDIFCSYYWNGCTERNTTKAWLWEFPSLLVRSTDTNPASYVHKRSEIQGLSTMVMLTDGIWFDGQQKPARIAARHKGDNGPRSKTVVVFYDSHTETLDRKPDNNWADDPFMNRTNLQDGPPYFRIKDQPTMSTGD